jgi:hypothetical protein
MSTTIWDEEKKAVPSVVVDDAEFDSSDNESSIEVIKALVNEGRHTSPTHTLVDLVTYNPHRPRT